ncbi:MAG: DegV family protein [Actinomycetota bacterium]
MAAGVRVVTDSTAYLPAELVRRHGIEVVPLQVVLGGRAFDEGEQVHSDDVASALRRWTPVTTSRPSPAVLLAAYERLADAGADEIVSVHLSSGLSGTYEAARLAARDAPVPVHVVDSMSLGMGLGYAALEAAGACEAGATGEQAAAAAQRLAGAVRAFFYVDTLEHLRRGGRIGAAQALIGSALAVKPLLTVREGRIVPMEKVRTASRALARLEEVAVAAAGETPVRAAVHHLASPARAEQLSRRLRERLPRLTDLHTVEVGPVVGAHVGPGMVAAVVVPATSPPQQAPDVPPSTGR